MIIIVIAIRKNQPLHSLRAIAVVSLNLYEWLYMSSAPLVGALVIDVPKKKFSKNFDLTFSTDSTTFT